MNRQKIVGNSRSVALVKTLNANNKKELRPLADFRQ